MLHFPKWKIGLILITALVGFLLVIPNFFDKDTLATLPGWVPKNQLVLGLDLQGGSHLLLQVDTDAVVKERVDALRDDIRRLLRDARIGYVNLRASGDKATFNLRDAADLDKAKSTLRELESAGVQAILSGNVREVSMTSTDAGQFTLTLTPEGIQHRISAAVEQSIEIVRRRIDELGTTEPNIQRQGADRILVQVPGLQDPQRLKDILGQTAKMTFRLVDVTANTQQAIEGRPPPGTEVLYSKDDPPVPYVVETRVLVSGENLVDAQPGFDQRTNEAIVTFRFDSTGARRFGQVTQQNVGRPFAIVLDNEVISAPVIREPILGGTGQISGNFTVDEANNLAILLRAGALPAPLTIIEERTVGPGLGADSIKAGEEAAIIATVLVIIFMILAYHLFGIISAVALMTNIGLLLGILSLLQATLTLPGIAGIVLTVGMAVDAN
ncbi:MAG: protein translocase subunit SecD, partial [Rhodobiaceae bacterium]|nr:protein translocase subunit SecD [Rhodobiaceae bacterium]